MPKIRKLPSLALGLSYQQHIRLLGFDGIPPTLEHVDGGIQPTLRTQVGRNFIRRGARGGAKDDNALPAICRVEESLLHVQEEFILLRTGANGVGIGTGKAVFLIICLAAGIYPNNFVCRVALQERLPADVTLALGIQLLLLTYYTCRRKPSTLHPIQHGTQGQYEKIE